MQKTGPQLLGGKGLCNKECTRHCLQRETGEELCAGLSEGSAASLERVEAVNARMNPGPSFASTPGSLPALSAALPSCTRSAPVAANPTTSPTPPHTVAALRSIGCFLSRKVSFFDACIDAEEKTTARNWTARRASETKIAVVVRGNCSGSVEERDEGSLRASSYTSTKMGVKEGLMQDWCVVVRLVKQAPAGRATASSARCLPCQMCESATDRGARS